MKWGGLSIARKLYLVVGVMAVLIAGELVTLRFSMGKLSAVRAFVGAEGLWSKSQKNAALALQRYALTHDERDYEEYLTSLKVPEGDHLARLELIKPHPNLAVVRAHFLEGQIHPDDVGPMIDLLLKFSNISYIHRAIVAWTEGDRLLAEFKQAGSDYRRELTASPPNDIAARGTLLHIGQINQELTALEDEFSDALGAGSRWMERIVNTLLALAVLMVESIGLTLTVRTSRRISRGLAELNRAARRIDQGDFSQLGEGWTAASAKRDEIGELAVSLTQMGRMLERSYLELEQRVAARTAELATLAEENAHLYQEAKGALATRDEFLSIASHELKTPLSALLLQLQLAQRVAATPAAPNRVEIFNKAVMRGRHLARLIDELLDLSRIHAGKFELTRADADLRATVAEAMGDLIADAERAGSRLTLSAEHAVPGRFDPLRMGQVVTNLVSNAIKYGDGKPIEISLVTSGEFAELRVRDQGVGIAAESVDGIFERFVRANATPGISGLGLGLYVVRQIVVAHGGEVWVSSQLGQGATFSVRIPLGTSVQTSVARRSPPAPVATV